MSVESLSRTLGCLAICLSAIVPLSATTIPLVDATSSWRYSDRGVLPPNQPGGVAWTSDAYADGDAVGFDLWDTGLGPFGYGGGLIYGANEYSNWGGALAQLHYGSDSSNKFITTYFRCTFTIPEGVDLNRFTMLMGDGSCDDGLVLYVNGVEFLRVNMPAAPTAIAASTLASSTVVQASPFQFEKAAATKSLFPLLKPYPEANVLAAEVHQASALSSDLAFRLDSLTLSEGPEQEAAARAGIKCSFDRHAGDILHLRPAGQSGPFAGWDTEMDWRLYSPYSSFARVGPLALAGPQPGGLLPSNALHLGGGSFSFRTEDVDIRGFGNVTLSCKLQALGNHAADGIAWVPYDAGDTVKVEAVVKNAVGLETRAILGSTSGTDFVVTTVVSETSLKKVLPPSSATVPANTGTVNWRTPAFVDTGWPGGTKGAGYDIDTSSATSYTSLLGIDMRTSMYNTGKTCFYMRAPFTVADKNAVTYMRLRMKFDDGFVAYVNDVKIAEFNYQPASGAQRTYPPVPTLAAPTDYGEANALQYKDFVISGPELQAALQTLDDSGPNRNVLAIYAFNVTASSSDLLCLPVLEFANVAPGRLRAWTALDDHNPGTYETISDSLGSLGVDASGAAFVSLEVKGSTSSVDKLIVLDDVEIGGTPASPVNYDTFSQLRLGSTPVDQRGPEADADEDTLSNIFEMLAGADPTVPAVDQAGGPSGPAPIAPRVGFEPDGRVTLRFRLPADSLHAPDASVGRWHFRAMDVEVAPEVSADAMTWSSTTAEGGPLFVPVGAPEPAGDGTGTAWVTVRSVEPLVGGADSLLVRLRATELVPGVLRAAAPSP